jgi:hypothetical protein
MGSPAFQYDMFHLTQPEKPGQQRPTRENGASGALSFRFAAQVLNVPYTDVKRLGQFNVIEHAFLLQKVMKINGKQSLIRPLGECFLLGLPHVTHSFSVCKRLFPIIAGRCEKHEEFCRAVQENTGENSNPTLVK